MRFIGRSGKKWNYFLTVFAAMLGLAFSAHGQSGPRGGKASEEAGVSAPSQATALPANTVQIRVECGNPAARVKTIADGLKLLGNLHPAVLLISGTCHENVVIQGLNGITLQGNTKATIDGGSDPNFDTVQISGSLNIALNNLTIAGGGEGVGCFDDSFCVLTQVTVQGSLGDGVGVGAGARVKLIDCVIQDNADVGLSVGVGSAALFGGQITGNASDGVVMRNGGTFGTAPGNLTANPTIQNNAGNGIRTVSHNTVILGSALITGNAANGVALQTGSAITLNASVITGNALDGVTLQAGSAIGMFASSITNNGGHQVRIGDLSIARFSGFQSNTISGANSPDVVCDPQFSATRQFVGGTVGATTNCPAELPPTP